MFDESNPGPPQESAPGTSGDELSRAFDGLIEGRSSRAAAPPAARRGTCPEPDEWGLLLNEGAHAVEADALLAHAAACQDCAEHLRMLSAGPSAEEAAELVKLMSASRDWQRNLAVNLARTSRSAVHGRGGKRMPRIYLWAGVGLAASLLIAGVFTAWWRFANTPERLLAEAYSHSRIFELRMPGAGFAGVTPQVHLRGGATGRDSVPLLDARARIERRLETSPQDPHW